MLNKIIEEANKTYLSYYVERKGAPGTYRFCHASFKKKLKSIVRKAAEQAISFCVPEKKGKPFTNSDYAAGYNKGCDIAIKEMLNKKKEFLNN